jgi:hypothetical protein
MKKIWILALLFMTAVSAIAQQLESFSITVTEPNSKKGIYFDLSASNGRNSKATNTATAKSDFSYTLEISGQDTVRSFYSLGDSSGKLAASIQEAGTRINAISWDLDTWNKCKTMADLQRMARHITMNSFSFYAVLSNNHVGAIDYPCFIFQKPDGKRGVFYVTKLSGGTIRLDVRMEP